MHAVVSNDEVVVATLLAKHAEATSAMPALSGLALAGTVTLPDFRTLRLPLRGATLLMLAACNVVRATAVHVVLVRSGPHVAVG